MNQVKSNNKRSRKKKIWIVAGIIIGLIIVRTAFCGKKEKILFVQTEKVRKYNITQLVSATGKINPVYQVIITPEVTGEIVELPVKDGQKVKKGQLLIKIKPDTYLAQKDRASANLDSAQANLNMRKNELNLAETEYKRAENLFNNGISNQQEMDRVKSDLESKQAMVDSQLAMIQQAQAALKETVESLNKTTIYSPIDGTISQLNVELGERILGSGFSQGTNLMTVANLNQMEAIVEVDENDVVLISINDMATIEVDAFKERKFSGKVYEIANSAKTLAPGSQEQVVNFEVKIAIQDFEQKIRPGMSCNAEIETETRNNVLAVPIQSITARSPEDEKEWLEEKKDENSEVTFGMDKKNGKKVKPKEVVFVIKDNVAKMKEVQIGISDDTYIEVIRGLKEGEEVISGPYKVISRELKDGSKVKLEDYKNKKRMNF